MPGAYEDQEKSACVRVRVRVSLFGAAVCYTCYMWVCSAQEVSVCACVFCGHVCFEPVLGRGVRI